MSNRITVHFINPDIDEIAILHIDMFMIKKIEDISSINKVTRAAIILPSGSRIETLECKEEIEKLIKEKI